MGPLYSVKIFSLFVRKNSPGPPDSEKNGMK
jgi:hypothetical protein